MILGHKYIILLLSIFRKYCGLFITNFHHKNKSSVLVVAWYTSLTDLLGIDTSIISFNGIYLPGYIFTMVYAFIRWYIQTYIPKRLIWRNGYRYRDIGDTEFKFWTTQYYSTFVLLKRVWTHLFSRQLLMNCWTECVLQPWYRSHSNSNLNVLRWTNWHCITSCSWQRGWANTILAWANHHIYIDIYIFSKGTSKSYKYYFVL